MIVTTHDWIAICIAVFSVVLVPVVGTYFRVVVKNAVDEMEERVELFIKIHEKDPFAHPNLAILERMENKLDAIHRDLTNIRINCVNHTPVHRGEGSS